jgi:nicotinamidase-related amidase
MKVYPMNKMTFLSFLRLLLVAQIGFAAPSFAQVVGDKPALVIIDMQEFFINRGEKQNEPENKKKVSVLVEEQLRLIEHAKSQGMPIIFMEYASYGPTNPRLMAAVAGYSDTKTFLKNTDGMFSPDNQYLAGLTSYLQEEEVGNLIIAGANGGACVKQSISGALDNNFSVTAMSSDIADFNYDDFIYPYDDYYQYPAQCPAPRTCTFRELDDLATLIDPSSLQPPPQSPTAVNDSDRSLILERNGTSNEREPSSNPNSVPR